MTSEIDWKMLRHKATEASAHAYANSKIVSALDSRLHINICNQSAGHEQAIRDGAARMLLDDSKSRHGQTKSRPD